MAGSVSHTNSHALDNRFERDHVSNFDAVIRLGHRRHRIDMHFARLDSLCARELADSLTPRRG
jgi:hypothetical protein